MVGDNDINTNMNAIGNDVLQSTLDWEYIVFVACGDLNNLANT